MEKTDADLLRLKIKIERRKIIADIILIVVFILIFFYIYSNIESFKTLGKDVCRMCEAETGGRCIKGFGNLIEEPDINFDFVLP